MSQFSEPIRKIARLLEILRVERNLRCGVVGHVPFEAYACVEKKQKRIGVARANAVNG